MTTIGVGFGRAIVIVALLCYGNSIRVAVDAFQTRRTELFRPVVGFSTSRQTNDWIVPRNQQCWQSRNRGRVFSSAMAAAASTNATSANDVVAFGDESGESPTASEVFFPPLSDASAKKRGRKRRAIQKLRQKHFSRPIDSRLFRTMLFPMSLLVWKPFWKIMDVSIARLEEESTTSVSTAPQTVEDVSLAVASVEESSSAEKNSKNIEMPVSEVASSTEAMPLQSAASTIEETPETIQQEVASESQTDVSDTVVAISDTPAGDRWAVAAPGVDLSGKWELIITDDFKVKYDKYLEGLGQPKIVRSVALSGPVIGKTMEELLQSDQGRSLEIRGKNIRGTWDRTLVASGSTENSPDFEPLVFSMKTVDQEIVEAEAWWEDEGKSHVSWMRGVTMYGGGSFYSRRYFEEKEHEDDETVYVCEGFFEFNDPNKPNNELTWRFRRMKQ